MSLKILKIDPDADFDWELLRDQKISLLETIEYVEDCDHFQPHHREHLDGILGIIDYMQDAAAEELGEEKVFGVDNPEGV